MTASEKQEALRQVLDSPSLARSGQLKKFLRYVCELEIAGRAAEIKEYSIGTEALGRPGDYSPVQDSSVRRRAFELRAKLDEIYQRELLGTPVVIELPKGSYVPVFRSRSPATPADGPASSGTAVISPARTSWKLAGVLALGLLFGAGAMRWLPAWIPGDSVLQEEWGPMVAEGNVLLCLATPFHMAVRSGNFRPKRTCPSSRLPMTSPRCSKKPTPGPAPKNS